MLGDHYQDAEEGRDFIFELLTYYFSVCELDKKVIEEEIIPQLPLNLKSDTMTIAEHIRKRSHQEGREEGLQEGRQAGREEGREEGLQEGREEGQLEMMIKFNRAIEILKKTPQLSDEKIANLVGIPVEQVRRLRSNIK